LLHLNDSKFGLGSHRDRHELIGEGQLGEGVFRRLMADERLARLPKVIETPKLDDAAATDTRMLARLRSYVAQPDLAGR
jgi:deoxyribonuclease-4